MSVVDLMKALRDHAFTRGFDDAIVMALAKGARWRELPKGDFLAKEGGSADEFFLIHSGRALVEVHDPGRGPTSIQTLDPGSVAGWSWLVPPHRWQFDVRAIEPVGAIVIDAAYLRHQCDSDHDFGYQLLRRLVDVIASRLAATRLHLLDVFK